MYLFNLFIVKNNMKIIFKEGKLYGVYLYKDCCFFSGW